MVLDSDVCTLVWEVITGFPGDYSRPGYPSPYITFSIRRWVPFIPIRIVMVSQNLADLIHEPQFRIWFEFGLIFHDINQ